MAEKSRRRNVVIAVVAVIVIVILLLLGRCLRAKPATEAVETIGKSVPAGPAGAASAAQAETQEPDEVLSAATLKAPASVGAGAAFGVAWTGPDNRGDHVTIVKADVAADVYGSYRDTKEGATLELTAPIEPGMYEVRYVTGRSRTILARVPIEVAAATATLEAPAEVVLGSSLPVMWTGPNNQGDYVTIVPKEAADEVYGNYADTAMGSPANLTAPTVTGDAELRYVSGQGRKVLGRRPIRVVPAEVSLSVAAEVIAGSSMEVGWTGPNNAGDYITVVPAGTPDGSYGNYTSTTQGSPLKLLAPIMTGEVEVRYQTGQGDRVLARRALKIVAAEIKLSAAKECGPEAPVSVTWTGPNNPGDYITIVAKGTPEGQYGAYANTTSGSPVSVRAPKEVGEAEIWYVAGQGSKTLARIPIKVVR